MKNIIFTLIILVSFSYTAKAQSNSIASSLGLYVFPAKGQDQATQDTDETACYKWAMSQTGYDPMNPTKVQAAQVDKSPDGSAIVGSAGGAAAGAAIGAIAGDAGEGAAIGAVVGALRGRRARISHNQQEQQANNQAAANQNTAMKNDYNNAFSACMEGKGYTVK
jgi:hypothetical protein